MLLRPGQGVDVVVLGSDVGGGWIRVDVGYAGREHFQRGTGIAGLEGS